jgi:hypothetical protein
MPVAVSFVAPSGALHKPQTVNLTGLTVSTDYLVTLTTADGHTRRVDLTTDGAGAATLTFVPNTRGAWSYRVDPKVPVATASGSNSFTGV